MIIGGYMLNKYSDSKYVNMLLKMIDKTVGLDFVDKYVGEVSSRDYIVMTSSSQIDMFFANSLDVFLSNLTYDELLELRSYTGYEYKFINAILRNNWTYDEHGMLDLEKKIKYRNLAERINVILSKFNSPNIDFVSFRGTTLDSFSSYGVFEISDLNKLKGQYLYDSAFVSTSVFSESSYINKRLDDGRNCNIGIKYLIPSESSDGALLINKETSYSISQSEYLLKSGVLSKVIDVKVDEVNNTAMLTVILVPKKVYEFNYEKNKNIKR